MNDNKLKMNLSEYGPVWSRVLRFAPIIVRKPDILNFKSMSLIIIINPVASTYIFSLAIIISDL